MGISAFPGLRETMHTALGEPGLMRNLFVTVLATLILLDRSSTYLFKCARWSSLLLWLGVIACGRLLAYV